MTTVPGRAIPPVVDRDEYERELALQIEVEKELTRWGDRVAARRRRLPMTQIEDYVFSGDEGDVRLSELFGECDQLVLQTFMFHPEWEEGCPSCTWAATNMPREINNLLVPNNVAFAMVSRAPLDRLQSWSAKQGWDHLRWVSSASNSFNTDWGWTVDGQDQPGYSYLLRTRDGVYLTYRTFRRGTEAILPTVAIWDRTVYGRQQDFEDSPAGWPQEPTYG
ncbi:DUF899 family protein [Dietzia alimentaria]|uniref:DUF899 family protein n=1 Tax=Dietzia alimentaria TaxID=665550 RepID=UPI00029AC2A1|nr:DUF899 family protein [Dietzia alimentaria]